MLIYVTTHEGTRMAVNTNFVVSIEPFDLRKAEADLVKKASGLSGAVQMMQLNQNRDGLRDTKCLMTLSTNSVLALRDEFQAVTAMFSMSADIPIPGTSR